MASTSTTGTHMASVPGQRRAPITTRTEPHPSAAQTPAGSSRSSVHHPTSHRPIGAGVRSPVQSYVDDASWPRVRFTAIRRGPAQAATSVPGRSPTGATAPTTRTGHELCNPANVRTSPLRTVGFRVAQTSAALTAIATWAYMAGSTGGTGGNTAHVLAIFVPPIAIIVAMAGRKNRSAVACPVGNPDARSVADIVCEAERFTQPSVAASASYVRQSSTALLCQATASSTTRRAIGRGWKPVSLCWSPEMAAGCSLHLSQVASLGEPWVTLRGGLSPHTTPVPDRR